MTKLERIDTWLIEVPYQGLVDWSQRKPAWWAENAAIAMAVSGWVEAVLRGWLTQPFELFITVVMSIFAAVVIRASKVENGLSFLLSSELIRRMTLVMMALAALGVMLRLDPMAILSHANAIAYLSIWYFAACNPPKPKRRTQDRLATVAGGA